MIKYNDYKNFMIVSTGTALMLQDETNFSVSAPEPVECNIYPHANLYMCGTLQVSVPKTEEYPDGRMTIAVYVDSNLPFINPNGK